VGLGSWERPWRQILLALDLRSPPSTQLLENHIDVRVIGCYTCSAKVDAAARQQRSHVGAQSIMSPGDLSAGRKAARH
jgi:hypothetical protein